VDNKRLLASMVEDPTTTSPPWGIGLPTSISQSRPSKRQSSLKIRRGLGAQPTAICERLRSSL
jgi:hypothetical protein